MKTRPMGIVASTMGVFLDLLGRDCPPLQYLRELTQNSIEAIGRAQRLDVRAGRTPRIGKIVWDCETVDRVRKLSITDNGDGMNAEELELHINHLSSTHAEQRQAPDANFGVGAKIAAVTRNHAGLDYASWRSPAEGFTLSMWRDPQTGEYGMKPMPTEDGGEAFVGLLPDSAMPALIRESRSGTKVVLLGMTPKDDTFAGPAGAGGAIWLRRYLNTRYFAIPDGIEVQSRDDDKGNTGLRTVIGQGPMLDAVAIASGTVRLSAANAHWWIVPKEKDELPRPVKLTGREIKTMGTFTSHHTRGHVACLFQNELYHLALGHLGGYAMLQQFGVIFGYQQVVMYLEPTLGQISTDTSRSRVIVDGATEPPWTDWAAEFRTSMPKELRDFIERVGVQRDPKQDEAMRERIRSVMDLYPIPKFKRDPQGSEYGQPDEPGSPRRGPASPPDDPPEPRERPSKPRMPAVRPNSFGLPLKPARTLGKMVDVNDVPRPQWIRVADGTRPPEDMVGIAARFIPGPPPQLVANGDFGPFVAMVERFAAQFPGSPAAKDVCRAVVEDWFGQVLCEVVVGAHHLRSGSEPWPEHRIKEALSEAALTMAVMPRYLVHSVIKRDIYSKLGKPGPGAAG